MNLLRALILLLFAITQMVFAFRPDLFGIEGDIGSMADRNRTILVPAGVAFAIWLFLYAGGVYVALWHAVRRNLAFASPVGWWAAAAFLGNSVWALHQPVFGPGAVSFFLLLPILVCAYLAAWAGRRDPQPSLANRWAYGFLWGLAGWITAASAAGASLALKLGGLWPLVGSEATSSLVLLAAWAPLALFLSYRAAAYAYAGPVMWGLLMILAVNQDKPALMAMLAGLAAAVFVASLLGKRRVSLPA